MTDYRTFLTLPAVAERLGRSVATVRQWVVVGVGGVRLPAAKVGGAWLVDPAAVDPFIERVTRLALGEQSQPQAATARPGATPAGDRDRAQAALDRLRERAARPATARPPKAKP